MLDSVDVLVLVVVFVVIVEIASAIVELWAMIASQIEGISHAIISHATNGYLEL